MHLLIEWPESAFETVDEAAHVATRALSDASKALGVSEPTVRAMRTREDWRDAQTGRFVSEADAGAHPDVTTHEQRES